MNNTARKEKRQRAQQRRAVAEANKPSILPKSTTTVWFLAIFGCAFLLRMIYLAQIESIPLFYYLAGDGRTYDEWGQRIAAGDWLGEGVFYQAPLYPYFLGVLHFLFGRSLWLVRIVQITLGSAACALIFRVGERLFSRPAGIAAGLILACYAPAIFFDGLIEKSVLDLFLLTVLLFILSGVNQSEGWWWWLGAGVVLGLLGLSRENALVLAPVVMLWIVLYFSERSLSVRAGWLGMFFAGLLLIIVPVGLRNLAVGGEFTLTTAKNYSRDAARRAGCQALGGKGGWP
jgi:4-amino-4-deoxy-L-arabinose transferase-like glycosyltransferase